MTWTPPPFTPCYEIYEGAARKTVHDSDIILRIQYLLILKENVSFGDLCPVEVTTAVREFSKLTFLELSLNFPSFDGLYCHAIKK